MAESRDTPLIARLQRIRQRLQRNPFVHFDPSETERWIDTAPVLELDGEDFVRAAYLRILRREPDPPGLRYHTTQLRSGQLTKPELLTALAQSPEGQQYRVRFVGLSVFPVQQPFRGLSAATADAFVRALGRYYNGCEPADDSFARWVALLDSGKLSRDEVSQLFAASAQSQRAQPDELLALSSTLTDIRQELEWHQRALESLLPRIK